MTKPTRAVLSSLFFVVCIAPAATSQGAAQSVTITSHLTADNHYALYHGHPDASDLTLVGRNRGRLCGQRWWRWNEPETWVFDADADEYLYVVAWDDADSSTLFSMWIGDFSARRTHTLVSNHDDWECMRIRPALGQPGAFGESDLLDVTTAIATGAGSQPQADAFNLRGFVTGRQSA
jgi:hypothetical protein